MSTGTETGQRRRRVRLTPVRSIPVEFAGERAGEGPLTLGQLNVCAWVSGDSEHFYAILCAELPVPGVASVGDVAGAIGVLIARHESLRTAYVPGQVPGEPLRQRVAAAGVQRLVARPARLPSGIAQQFGEIALEDPDRAVVHGKVSEPGRGRDDLVAGVGSDGHRDAHRTPSRIG